MFHYDMNSKLLHWGFKNRTFWCLVFEWCLKTGPFGNQPNVDHTKTGHVRFLDPHCSSLFQVMAWITDHWTNKLKAMA